MKKTQDITPISGDSTPLYDQSKKYNHMFAIRNLSQALQQIDLGWATRDEEGNWEISDGGKVRRAYPAEAVFLHKAQSYIDLLSNTSEEMAYIILALSVEATSGPWFRNFNDSYEIHTLLGPSHSSAHTILRFPHTPDAILPNTTDSEFITAVRTLAPILASRFLIMRNVLLMVEWVQNEDITDLYCPWCGEGKTDGHSPTCVRQQALDADFVQKGNTRD